ncbi:MAG: Folylpolyglutamate synthase [Elusimicrobia bacterium ADurb.Bin231]|nr:MAG: Folylpolyglutamate synthase [Elusimicrobia bacterium ADurb.Bin231]
MKYKNALEYIDSLEEFSYKFGLGRIKNFLTYLGCPQDAARTVHVAGTNGKGSVCAFITSILRSAGYKTGLYISPHITSLRERIQVNGSEISKKEVSAFVDKYRSAASSFQLTYFEFITAMAFWYFKKCNTDYNVLETGLGGRLDATNIVKRPVVSVITNVSFDHTKILGASIEKIAFEKAGIIKKNVPVVTAAEGKALSVIKKIAADKKCRICAAAQLDGNVIVPLRGAHQIVNAGTAVSVARVLGIAERQIKSGIENVRFAGRFDVRIIKYRGSDVAIIFDGAHNPAASQALSAALKEYLRGEKICFVFGVLADKHFKKIVKNLSDRVSMVVVAKPDNPRGAACQTICREFAFYMSRDKIYSGKSVSHALVKAIKQLDARKICITGSFYTVSEGLQCLKNMSEWI